METKLFILEPLIDKLEQYTKTSLELLKLKSIDKSSDLIAIYLGTFLENNYYGFLLVTIGYVILGVVLFSIKKIIQLQIKKQLVTQILN